MEALQDYFQKILQSEIQSLEDRIEKKLMQLRNDMEHEIKVHLKADSVRENRSEMNHVRERLSKQKRKKENENAANEIFRSNTESSVSVELVDKQSIIRKNEEKQVPQKRKDIILKRNGVLMEDREVEWAHEIESRMTSLQVAMEKTINCLLINVETLLVALTSQRFLDPITVNSTTTKLPSSTQSSSCLNKTESCHSSTHSKNSPLEAHLSTPTSCAFTNTSPSLAEGTISFQPLPQKDLKLPNPNSHFPKGVSPKPIVSNDAPIISTLAHILPFLNVVDATTKSSFTSYTPTASSNVRSLTMTPAQDYSCHSITSSIVSSTASKTNTPAALSRKWWQRWNFSNVSSPTSSAPTSPLKTTAGSVIPDLTATTTSSQSSRSIFYTLTPSSTSSMTTTSTLTTTILPQPSKFKPIAKTIHSGISTSNTSPSSKPSNLVSSTAVMFHIPTSTTPELSNSKSIANTIHTSTSTSNTSPARNPSNLVHSTAVTSRIPTSTSSFNYPSSSSNTDSCILVTSSSRWPSAFRDLETALHVSARLGNTGEVRRLLAAGVNVSATSRSEVTALHWAAQEGHVEVATILLDAGANVDCRTSHNSTPLHYAASNGHSVVVCLLLHRGASVHVTNVNGWTPLHCVALHGDEETARLLLEAGGDAREKNAAGISPLDIKPIKGIPNVFTRLLFPSSEL